jgi:hypothetical protein
VTERLGDQDYASSAGKFLVEHEDLAERAAWVAQALHPRVFAG